MRKPAGQLAGKATVDDLACLGGAPAFSEALHVGRPNIGDRNRLLDRINDALSRRWLTNDAPFVAAFEQEVAERVGVRHCVATCNATLALQITLRAAELTGEVIVPSFTFVATAHALEWQGITPVFCDVEPHTYTLDPSAVEELITPRTSGIIGVHLWGRPCRIDALREIAERNALTLIFDAAQAFGCSWRGRPLGGFGDAEIFSFHATKIANSLEGGAVVTNDARLADSVRLMRNYGFSDLDEVASPGTNAKMNEFSAAMGLTSLESLESFLASNRRNYGTYRKSLEGLEGVRLLEYDPGESNCHYIVVEIDDTVTGLTRDEFQTILWAENVLARRYFWPGSHRLKQYRSRFPEVGKRLPVTERIVSRLLSLPTGEVVRPEDIGQICELVRFIHARADEIHARLVPRRRPPV
jgi:dTDP-4-amino-4,6-dideoxygalactose transaminase